MVQKKHLIIVAGVLLAIIIVIASNYIGSSSSKHILRFGIFDSSKLKYYIVDGDVYLNGLFMGKTRNGLLEMVTCVPGEVEFRPDIAFKLDSNDKLTYNIECNRNIHDFSLANKEKLLSELSVATKFLPYIVYENTLIRKNAVEITRDCPVNDRTCMTNQIFNSIVASIKYVEDARDVEHAQSVAKTLNIKAGDCEDFTIILSSYLESVGIKTKLLLTNSHIYMLACNLDDENVRKTVPAGKPYFWYDISGERCYVLDPTIPGSYLGYSANVLGEKIAVDPITKEYFILDKQTP